MADDFQTDRSPEARDDRRRVRRFALGWWVFAAIALFYLISEHRVHLFGGLPYLLLLACPLIHIFMHGRHGGHGGHGHAGGSEEDKK